MILKTATFSLLLLAACSRLSAQTAEVYASSFDSAGGGTIFAAGTMDASMQSGSCTHTYNWSLGLGGPAGVNQVGGGSDYWQGLTTTPFSETINSQIASNVPGTYTLASSGTAFCSCVEEQFYTDPWTDPTILQTGPPTIYSGGIGVYPTGGSGEIYTVEPGTTGQLAIYGTYLTAGGQDLSPTVTATNGISITGLTSIQDGQLNVSYNAASATPGTAYVTVKTNVGQTSPPQGSIAVGDMTPVITSISVSNFTVGTASNGVQFTGLHLGTNCPSLTTLPFSTWSVSTYSCTDESFYADITPSGTGSGPVTMTDKGYGGDLFYADAGQSGTAQSPGNIQSAQPTPTISEISPDITMIGASNVSLTITGTGFGTSAKVNLPGGITATEDQPSSPTTIVVIVNISATATIGNNNFTVTSEGLTSPGKNFTVNGPSIIAVVSDITGLCAGCTKAVARRTTYQVKNFDGSVVGVLPICEAPTFTGWSCTAKESHYFNACTPTQSAELGSNGQFTDQWSMASDAYAPVGCGFNVADHWYWYQSAATQNILGTLTGYVHTNAVSINGVVSPAELATGYVVPH